MSVKAVIALAAALLLVVAGCSGTSKGSLSTVQAASQASASAAAAHARAMETKKQEQLKAFYAAQAKQQQLKAFYAAMAKKQQLADYYAVVARQQQEQAAAQQAAAQQAARVNAEWACSDHDAWPGEAVCGPGSVRPPAQQALPPCPTDQGPIYGDWCQHSANGPDNPGYVELCPIPGEPKSSWPAAVNGKC